MNLHSHKKKSNIILIFKKQYMFKIARWWHFPSTSNFVCPQWSRWKKHLRLHRSCRSIDLNRKGLIEEDGDSLAAMLEKNKGLRRLVGRGGANRAKLGEISSEQMKNNTTILVV